MSELLKSVLKEINNPYACPASDGILGGDVTGYVDTGAYMLNALMSGSIHKGLPKGKITAIAGESSTGKTYLALSIVRTFLDADPEALVFYFESEGAISTQMLEERLIDTTRVGQIPVNTVQDFKHQALLAIDGLKSREKKTGKKVPVLFILDSLGQLASAKEVDIAREGVDTLDMTRAKQIRGMARVLTFPLAINGITMIVTNHTYAPMSAYSGREMSGGEGMKYASDQIIFLSKRKDKEGLIEKSGSTAGAKDVKGNIITGTVFKGRLSKENSKAEIYLHPKHGLFRYFGMIDMAIQADLWKQTGAYVEVCDGSKHYKKEIYQSPETFFTPAVMDGIDAYARSIYLYGETADREMEEDLGIKIPTSPPEIDPPKPKRGRKKKPQPISDGE